MSNGNKTKIITASERQTAQTGRELGGKLQAGQTVLLFGGLGAGKTVFAKGLARGLGVEENVTSPTFAIMNRYETRLKDCPLFHFDLYRNPAPEEFYGLGFADILAGNGISVIEWAENLPSEFAKDSVRVEIALLERDANGREITITSGGK